MFLRTLARRDTDGAARDGRLGSLTPTAMAAIAAIAAIGPVARARRRHVQRRRPLSTVRRLGLTPPICRRVSVQVVRVSSLLASPVLLERAEICCPAYSAHARLA